jgi:hypothetical protein
VASSRAGASNHDATAQHSTRRDGERALGSRRGRVRRGPNSACATGSNVGMERDTELTAEERKRAPSWLAGCSRGLGRNSLRYSGLRVRQPGWRPWSLNRKSKRRRRRPALRAQSDVYGDLHGLTAAANKSGAPQESAGKQDGSSEIDPLREMPSRMRRSASICRPISSKISLSWTCMRTSCVTTRTSGGLLRCAPQSARRRFKSDARFAMVTMTPN